MKYTIYCAHTKEEDIINITCGPGIDLAYYKKKYDINRIELLTPSFSISYVDYIIRNIEHGYNPVQRLIMRGRKKDESLKAAAIKKLAENLGLKTIRKPKVVDMACEIPLDNALNAVLDILKGRIMSYMELGETIKKMGLFLEYDLGDILQTLYLTERIKLYPSIYIDKIGKKYTCKACDREMTEEEMNSDYRCSGCGSYLQVDDPLFACEYEKDSKAGKPVKFKEYKKLTFPQGRASIELCTFLRSDANECLLWCAPGAEDINITSRVIREVLNSGGRCAIAVSCHDEGLKYHSIIKETFPNSKSVFHEGAGPVNKEDIVICRYEDIRRYYSAFDLIILSEESICRKRMGNHIDIQAKRALREGGKVIYADSTPEYKLYKKAADGEIKLVTVPLRANGRPCPEPRVMTYKFLAEENCFIPIEVMDFILWFVNEGRRIHIIVPSSSLIDKVRQELINTGEIKDEWLEGHTAPIMITTLPCSRVYTENEESVIVLFADDSRIFDEKSLLDAAGLAGRLSARAIGEVLFVASKESDEMDNAKLMLRHLNKTAWEMGYLK